MIFGFNTDIKHEGTVYHVQSEARKAEKLLQTQVFVRGRCIGKRATSYAEMEQQPDFTEDHMHDMLKVQHRGMIDGIRGGKLNELLGLDETGKHIIPAEAYKPGNGHASPSASAAAAAAAAATTAAATPAATSAAPTAPAVAASLKIQLTNPESVYAESSVVMHFTVTENGAAVSGAQLTSRL